MKYIWVLLLCVLISGEALGQQINPMFYKVILLRHKPYTLQTISEEMLAQSGISFSYNAAIINPKTKIRIRGKQATVAEILATIKKKTGISYKIISQRHIIYIASAGKEKANSKPKKIKRNHKTQAKKAPLVVPESDTTTTAGSDNAKATNNNKPVVPAAKDSTAAAGHMIASDSNLMMSSYGGGGGSGGGGGGSASDEENPPPHIPERRWRNGIGNNNGDGVNAALNFFANNLLVAAGASVDETYYLNPTLKFGFNFLYGIASYNIGGNGNTWRFGLGGAAKIDEHWSMHFVVTTGQSVSKHYTIIYPDTSISAAPLTVTSKLTRFGISTNYSFGNGFAVEGGLTFNSLKTNYTSDSHPVTLSDILPAGYDADEKYPGIKPPYTLGNNYSGNSTGNTKTWLGFQVTLLYQLRFAEE